MNHLDDLHISNQFEFLETYEEMIQTNSGPVKFNLKQWQLSDFVSNESEYAIDSKQEMRFKRIKEIF